MTDAQAATVPSTEELRDGIRSRFGYTPCMFQIQDIQAQLGGEDCITVAATGSGKTLTFWGCLPFIGNRIIVVVTALNILGDQNVAELQKLGYRAVNLTADNISDHIFQEIASGVYSVVIASPEKIGSDKRFLSLFKNEKFISKLFNVSIDECHCVQQWGSEFRPMYSRLGHIRWRLPDNTRFHAVSATLPDYTLEEVRRSLKMRSTTKIIRCSNNRPNITLSVERMKSSAHSWSDLRRILQLDNNLSTPPPKFMVFTNRRAKAQEGVEALWNDIPVALRHKIRWFHAVMSPEFREETIADLREGKIWGLVCTEAAGMGLDIPDIELVIQVGYVESLCVLMQRMGRGARKRNLSARGIYLVESPHFDGHKDQNKTKAKTKNTTSAKNTNTNVQPRDLDTTVNGQLTRDCSSIPFPTLVSTNSEAYELAVMDLFINADKRGPYCRRGICDRYFDNYKATFKPTECGCTQCDVNSVVNTSTCCDVCHGNQEGGRRQEDPEYSTTTVQARVGVSIPRKYNVRPYKPLTTDMDLRNALRQWRKEQLVREGLANEQCYGPHIIVGNDTLQLIVDLAHSHKIPNVAALRHQTGWCDAEEYGDAILHIVRTFYPVPPVVNEPMESNTTNNNNNPPSPSFQTTTSSSVSKSQLINTAHPLPTPRSQSTQTLSAHKTKKRMRNDIDKENILPEASTKPLRAAPRCSHCNQMGHRSNSPKCQLSLPKPRLAKAPRLLSNISQTKISEPTSSTNSIVATLPLTTLPSTTSGSNFHFNNIPPVSTSYQNFFDNYIPFTQLSQTPTTNPPLYTTNSNGEASNL